MTGKCRLCDCKTDDLWNLTIAELDSGLLNGNRFRVDVCPVCLPKIHAEFKNFREARLKQARLSGKLMDKAFGSGNTVPRQIFPEPEEEEIG